MVSTRSSSAAMTASPLAAPLEPKTPRRAAKARAAAPAWTHVAPASTLVWMAVSLPLVIWDTGYVLGRPATMPGGWAHWPLWTPYELYGKVDGMYGFKQWNAGNGFTSAQGSLNVVETLMYLGYMGLWWKYGQPTAAGRALTGRIGAIAALVAFSASVMTLSKTVLYWLNEAYSGFDNISQNSTFDLILLWVIPNGLWLVFPTIMIYTLGTDIISGLTVASGAAAVKEE
ncbi:hypothetical protein GQ53DRAFT_742313 [Thozetella sp. PMI_491]|nr:hypothetical protein GQ53DRAFT_742313 [Thozetella sp. PMI_491]